MANKTSTRLEPDVAALMGEIVDDAERLIGEQVRLLRAEVGQHFEHARNAAVSFGLGAGLAATGGMLTTLMVVQGLHKATGLPLWACYGIVRGAMGAAGAGLLARARREASDVDLTNLPQSAQALKENLSWAKAQVRQATS